MGCSWIFVHDDGKIASGSPFLIWAACGGDFPGGELPTSNCCANTVAQTQSRRRGDRQRARKRPITRRFPFPLFSFSLSFSLSCGLFLHHLVTHQLRSSKQFDHRVEMCLVAIGNAGSRIGHVAGGDNGGHVQRGASYSVCEQHGCLKSETHKLLCYKMSLRMSSIECHRFAASSFTPFFSVLLSLSRFCFTRMIRSTRIFHPSFF